MFSFTKLAAVTVAAATLAVATPVPDISNSCNTGPVQCCNQVQSAGAPGVTDLLGLLGIVVDGVDAMVGLNCNPISVIGAGGGASCSAQPVCCEDNSHSLISLGCLPITL